MKPSDKPSLFSFGDLVSKYKSSLQSKKEVIEE
jgi:hypothetical protein